MSYPRSRRYGRTSAARTSGPRANKFAASCATCGAEVRAGAGLLEGGPGRWTVRHRPAEWHGSPVSGSYIHGCPADTARKNLAGQWGPFAEPRCASSTHAAQVTDHGCCDSCGRFADQLPALETELAWCEAEGHPGDPHRVTESCLYPCNAGVYAPVQAAPGEDLAELSRRAGGKYAYTSTGARMTVSSRRCEDAPCCGCCD